MLENKPTGLFEVGRVRFDFRCVNAGKVSGRECNRANFHAIRIGIEGLMMRATQRNGSNRRVTTPPNLPGLLSMQWSLFRIAKRMVYDVIAEDQDPGRGRKDTITFRM